MENEKMKILKMLEDGKITAGEASKLLETISRTSESVSSTHYSAPREATNRQTPPRPASTASSRSFEDFAGDMTKKFESIARDIEPKLQKFTEVVVEKTVSAADKISKSLAAPPSPPAASAHRNPAATPAGPEKSFELRVNEGWNEFTASALNGKINIKGYNGDKISAKVYCQPKNSRATIELMQLGNKYFFNYNEDDFKSVNIEAYIPEFLFKKITLQTVNGVINLSTVSSDDITISNLNGHTELSDVTYGNLQVESNNGKIKLNKLIGKNAKIENSGGDINVVGLDGANLEMMNFNGSISMIIPEYSRFSDYIWRVETGNSGLNMNLPGGMDIGYYVKAQTSLSSIKLGLTGMNYICNDKSYIEAKSLTYDHNRTKVKLSLETSNGMLVIN